MCICVCVYVCVCTERRPPAGTASVRWEQGLGPDGGWGCERCLPLRRLFPQLSVCLGTGLDAQPIICRHEQPARNTQKLTHTCFRKKKKRQHDSLHKRACWTPLGGGAAVRRSCSIMKHICSLITKAKVAGLAGSARSAVIRPMLKVQK